MTLTSPPYVLQQSSHGAQLFREAAASLIASAGGLVQWGELQTTQNGSPNMSVNVSGGRIWVPSTWLGLASGSGNTQWNIGGMYFAENDTTANLPISAADPTNPRIDLVIAQVQDAAYFGSTNSAQLAVLTGTPTAGASLTNLVGVASLPSSSVRLSYVLVPSGAVAITTANITNVNSVARLQMQGAGGVFSAHQTGPASVTANTWTKVQFGSTDFDTTAWWDGTTNYRFTAQANGTWVFSATVGFAILSSGTLNSHGNLAAIYKNGTLYSYLGAASNENAGANPGLLVGGALPVSLNAGDYVEVWAYVDTGGATGLGNYGYFTGWRVY